MKVLVVDDDPEMTRMLSQLLTSDGYEVVVASTRREALAAAAGEHPALVLLDVALGSEDGRELFVELREHSDVPVVFLTGRGLETDRIAGLRMGADDYVVKPFSPGELTARVAAAASASRRVDATTTS